MREYAFTTFKDISKRKHDGRDIVFFGAGDIAKKTLRKLDRKLHSIVDNNKGLWGEEELGVIIHSPNSICKEDFIIICTTSFIEVATYFATEPKPGQQSVNGKSLSTVFGIPIQVNG